VEKRRSGRNTKRKKYVDDVEYNFSEEELKRMPKEDADVAKTAAMEDILGPEEGGGPEPGSADNSLLADSAAGEGSNSGQAGPNYAFVVKDPSSVIFESTGIWRR
jgi:membrane protein involved in colicin uptake